MTAALNPLIRTLIIRTWDEMEGKGQAVTAKQVRIAVAKIVKANELKYGILPKLRTFQEIIREARKKSNVLNQSNGNEWTLASLVTNGNELPPESIPYVIKVWRYAINANETFTIMQAKWVSRFYKLWGDDISLLWYNSKNYSDIERYCSISGEPMTTFGPDLTNFFSTFEIWTLCNTNAFEDTLHDIFVPIIENQNGEIIEELLHYNQPDELTCFISGLADSYHEEFIPLMINLPSLDSIGFDENSKLVYLRFYTHIIKGNKWKELPPKQAANLIIELRKWVLTEYEKVGNDPDYLKVFEKGPWPSEILAKVGLEPNHPNFKFDIKGRSL